MLPVRKLLNTKVAKACGDCEKVLLKPGINPSQIQFDLRHVAWLFIPRFRLLPHVEPIPAEFTKNSEYNILFSVQHLVQEFMYFKIENTNHGNVTIPIDFDTDHFQYILPYQFDPDVDIELQEHLQKLQTSQKDPQWIKQRTENSVILSIPFVPVGDKDSSLKVNFNFFFTCCI